MKLTQLFRLRGTRESPSLFDKDFLFLHALSGELRRAVAALEGSDLMVLDVGSRARPYLGLFKGRHRRFVALDLPPRDRGLDLIASGEQMPLAAESIDVCLCTQVLEHVERPEVVIEELARVTRRGGTLLLSTHGVFHHHPFPHDYWRWTAEGLEKILSDRFDHVTVRPNGGTILLLFHVVGRGVMLAAERRRFFRPLRYTVYPLLNLTGLLLDRLIRERSLSINYLAIAKR